MALSYNGWPASRYPGSIGIVRFEPFPGHPFPAGVKGGDVHTIFTYLVKQLDARVEPIEEYRAGDEWGYYYKTSANSNSLSCHASGTAIDYNATQHPNGRRGTWTSSQLRTIRAIQAECSGVVFWLGDASRVPDEMHFEIRASYGAVAAAARKIRGGGVAPATLPKPTPKPEPNRRPVYRIRWFKSTGKPAAAYLCTMFLAEWTQDWWEDTAVWIPNTADLATWKKRGVNEDNTGLNPYPIRPSIHFVGGPYAEAAT